MTNTGCVDQVNLSLWTSIVEVCVRNEPLYDQVHSQIYLVSSVSPIDWQIRDQIEQELDNG